MVQGRACYRINHLADHFCYFCCNFLSKVLRVYDSRSRPLNRQPDLYLDRDCTEEIVGGVVETLLEIRKPDAAVADNHLKTPDSGAEPTSNHDIHTRELFFTSSPDKYVLVISTPFRKGSHVAQRPNDFLPIIEHLEKLHEAGYVHGDIRACNTLFPEEEGDPGYLIDFDFSGKAGTARYPTGYVHALYDGDRIGFEKKEIEMWQDWYALFQLMFHIHEFVPPGDGQFPLDFSFNRYWMSLETEPPVEKVNELKEILSRLQENGWTVKASRKYQAWLDSAAKQDHKTKQGATGSPPTRKLPL